MLYAPICRRIGIYLTATAAAIAVAVVAPVTTKAKDCAACINGKNPLCNTGCTSITSTCPAPHNTPVYCFKYVPVNMDYCAGSTNSSCNDGGTQKCADAMYFGPGNLCNPPGPCLGGATCTLDLITTSCTGSGSTCPPQG